MCMSMEALPRHRALPKRCLVVTMSRSTPERRQIDWPISWMVETKSSAKPPRVATRGMHDKPTERQLGRLEASLRWMPTRRTWPWVRAAPDNVRGWRGEITWTSRAAGREAESGTSPRSFF